MLFFYTLSSLTDSCCNVDRAKVLFNGQQRVPGGAEVLRRGRTGRRTNMQWRVASIVSQPFFIARQNILCFASSRPSITTTPNKAPNKSRLAKHKTFLQ